MLRPDPERLSTHPPYRRTASQALTEPLTTGRNPHRPRQRRRSLTVPRFPPLEAFERRPYRHVRSVAHRPASETLHKSGRGGHSRTRAHANGKRMGSRGWAGTAPPAGREAGGAAPGTPLGRNRKRRSPAASAVPRLLRAAGAATFMTQSPPRSDDRTPTRGGDRGLLARHSSCPTGLVCLADPHHSVGWLGRGRGV